VDGEDRAARGLSGLVCASDCTAPSGVVGGVGCLGCFWGVYFAHCLVGVPRPVMDILFDRCLLQV
jgi:hypothetical protein